MGRNSKLKIVMFEQGISQKELSALTGIPRSYISLSINGKFNLDKEQRKRMAKALRCKQQDIFDD